MLFHPAGCWDAGQRFGSEWEMLVESYCYSDPENRDFEILRPAAAEVAAAAAKKKKKREGKVGG